MVPEQMNVVIPNSPEYTHLGTSHHSAAYANLTDTSSVGYSIEKYCLPHFKPHSNRTHRAFVLGKYSMYLDNPDLCAWSTDHQNGTFGYLSRQSNGLGFAGTFQDAGEMLDRGVENFGGLTAEGFYELLGDNKVLVSTASESRSYLTDRSMDRLGLGGLHSVLRRMMRCAVSLSSYSAIS